MDYERTGREKSVIVMIREKALSDQAVKEKDYDVFMKQYMKVALWLFEHEVPHTANYTYLLDLVASFNKDLCRFAQTRDSNATYRSTTTCTEFMELMSDVLDEEATVKLKKSIDTFGSWALLADETSIHGVSFLGIYARYLETDTCDKVKEEMIDIKPIESTKAVALFEVIDDSLKTRGINIKTLKCVSFDGAAVMSSPVNGLYGHMKVRWELPYLVFQHCRAHRLQLVGRDAARNCPQAELALGSTAQTLYIYFHKSNKKLELLKKISLMHPDYDGYVRRLVEVAPTRWLSYSQAIGRLLKVYDHRFNKDTELLITMLPFYEEAWPESLPIVAAQLGFDGGRLSDEGKNVKRHCEHSTTLSYREVGKNFWMRFLSDSYTRAMFPEHRLLAAMHLTMPLGSCSVERCFSYTTRIACDSRAALTGVHISALVRISQNGPTCPALAEIKIQSSEDDNSEDEMNTFLQKVLAKWRMSPRRL